MTTGVLVLLELVPVEIEEFCGKSVAYIVDIVVSSSPRMDPINEFKPLLQTLLYILGSKVLDRVCIFEESSLACNIFPLPLSIQRTMVVEAVVEAP